MIQKILYYECFSGISGDMNLAAMLDLGVPEAHLRDGLAKLKIGGYRLRIGRDSKNGIFGTRVDVEPVRVFKTGTKSANPLAQSTHEHSHRGFSEIKTLIETSALDDKVKNRAIAIFRKLAEAEAAIHAQSVEQVHFHEVGAIDAIVDIVGAAICLTYLNVDKVICSSVELGGGFVKCQHGTIPVPAPAVTRLLAGAPVKSGAVNFETTTPTGAAILAACVDEFSENKNFTIRKTAYGVGHRDMDIPNLLRVYLGEQKSTSKTPPVSPRFSAEKAVLLECNIDDMSPELHGYLFEVLFAKEAQDVWITPIIMKKSRAALTLSVLSAPEVEEQICEVLFSQTTTIGLRRREIEKYVLERKEEVITTSLGEIRVKRVFLDGNSLRVKPEYEDLKILAKKNGISLLETQSIIQKEIG
jgi:uncharacterized protein (TIGR00299 family) protein